MEIVNVYHLGGKQKALDMGVIWIGRPSPLGNPYSHLEGANAILVPDREEAIRQYRIWLWNKIKEKDGLILKALGQLKETDTLGCVCKPRSCHGDVIMKAWKWCREKGALSS